MTQRRAGLISDQKSTNNRRPMTPLEAAEFLGLDPKTITRWARQGYLPGYPMGEGKRKFWRFIEGELVAWLADRRKEPGIA